MYFPRLMRVWVGNVRDVFLVQVSLILFVRRLWDISLGIGPCFALAGGLCKFYANNGGKRPIQRQPLLVRYKQQANPLLLMTNYTPLVTSWNDISKPTQTCINREI